jgi:hypothetical protein
MQLVPLQLGGEERVQWDGHRREAGEHDAEAGGARLQRDPVVKSGGGGLLRKRGLHSKDERVLGVAGAPHACGAAAGGAHRHAPAQLRERVQAPSRGMIVGRWFGRFGWLGNDTARGLPPQKVYKYKKGSL